MFVRGIILKMLSFIPLTTILTLALQGAQRASGFVRPQAKILNRMEGRTRGHDTYTFPGQICSLGKYRPAKNFVPHPAFSGSSGIFRWFLIGVFKSF